MLFLIHTISCTTIRNTRAKAEPSLCFSVSSSMNSLQLEVPRSTHYYYWYKQLQQTILASWVFDRDGGEAQTLHKLALPRSKRRRKTKRPSLAKKPRSENSIQLLSTRRSKCPRRRRRPERRRTRQRPPPLPERIQKRGGLAGIP
jgi:hypothetical protein